MTFTDYEKDPNHITFDFIKYYYSKLSMDSSKLYQIYNKNAVIKHSETTKSHDYNTPESIKKYWKTNSFLSNSKIIILTVNTVENLDSSLVATVVGEVLLEKDYASNTNNDIIPTRPFTQTFVLEKEEGKDAYMIKSDILTFIPDTDYEKAHLIDNVEVELVEDTTSDNINITDEVKAEGANGHTDKIKVQQEVVEKKVESIKKQSVTDTHKESSEKGKSEKTVSEQKPELTSSTASSNSEKSSPSAPSTPSSSNTTAKSLHSDASNTTATTTTTDTLKSSITATQSQSAPTTPPSGTKPKASATTEKPALIHGSWASAIKTSTSSNTLPSSVSHASITSTPNNSKASNEEPFTTVRSQSQNSNSTSNTNSNSNKKNSKTHPYEVFVQFKHAALPPKEKDLEEALKKKDYRGYKINVFKPVNAIVAFTTKEEQTRALEMKNILHKEVDYFIDFRNPKLKKKTYNNNGDKK
ncbi:hypothetical protein CANINC_004065 [Pichia inconspicua]|uniref:NTF2 domain-containing protein n=1 Tax=Pichia inconspicua TaxID=52247 RepID=A0A4T0WX47_9ASCO|nr:hypothetical protein CANINC_004065 [[Candida] inconspicua]